MPTRMGCCEKGGEARQVHETDLASDSKHANAAASLDQQHDSHMISTSAQS